ncbi:glycosyltransferase [Peribacillus kribbensis]|uniref:glycosyltransferase n=1 Tax=Peribacillus kribbensis TaxID=356658 RepID=UPI00041ABA2F|nr:glycosyltransferase [Peribacillus kribbensis]
MISVITCTIRDDFMENVFQNFIQQSFALKELIIVLNKDDMNLDKWKERADKHPNIRIYQLHENATLGDCLNFGILKSNYEIIAKFDDDDYYGPDYLRNAFAAFDNKDVMIAGKSSYHIYFKKNKALVFIPGEAKNFSDSVSGATLIFRKEIFNKIRFEKTNRAEDYFFLDQAKKLGYTIYSLDPYDFAVIRHDTDRHSWKISDKELMQWGELLTYTDDFVKLISSESKKKKRIKKKRAL